MPAPNTNISFRSTGLPSINIANTGSGVIIVEDGTRTEADLYTYYGYTDVDTSVFTDPNIGDYIKMAFDHGIETLYVVALDGSATSTDWGNVVDLLEGIEYNVITGITGGDATKVAILENFPADVEEKQERYITSICNPTSSSDNFSVINLDNGLTALNYDSSYPNLTGSDRDIETMAPAILGLVAGTPFSQSVTSKSIRGLTKVTGVATGDALDTRIDSGLFTLKRRSTAYVVADDVNSFTTISNTEGEEFKSIQVVNTMKLIKQSVADTFVDDYRGSFPNTYMYKQQFCTVINGFFDTLEDINYLQPTYNNRAIVDYDAHVRFIKSEGGDPSKMTRDQILQYNTGSDVLVRGDISIVRAMENLVFTIFLA